MRIIISGLFLTLSCLSTLFAQKLDHRLGYVMVQVEPGTSLENILSENSRNIQGELIPDRVLSKRLGIYLLKFDHSRIHEGKLLDQLRADRKIRTAQFDHVLENRAVPDDPDFSSQWQWLNEGQTGGLLDADIDADVAWEISKGGLTAAGDTIVVAIVDDGLDYIHEDIAANAWVNYHEIDGNGVDDDGNGYIDDVRGWNAYDETPEIWGENHGLNVAGMIGAVGNNQVGIAGINWNVKIMMIVGGTPESAAIASYAYALEQRAQYNETNGEKGAFVVATNSSWGINFGQPAEAPLWCAFYDSLGAYGILSAAATANLDIDIDAVGDLPTACPSEYLLSVTALNASNERTFSAFGVTQVDFGAPGEDIYTTRRNNGYGTTSGTSFASPVAAGLVALLYSAPCPGFADLVHTNPSGAAIFIRDAIFNGVESIPGMETTIRLGGGLNAGNSMELMMAICSDCPIPFAIDAHVLSNNEADITWSLLDDPDAINVRYRPTGTTTWDTLFNVAQPLTLTGLTGCTDYEIEFESICADTSTGFLSNYIFSTLGCCVAPSTFTSEISEEEALLSWNHIFAADVYHLQWRPENAAEWIDEFTPDTFYTIEGLEGCTYYEARISTDCDTSASSFSEIILFRTKGCGNCIDLIYCTSGSDDPSEEFIDSLSFGSLVSNTGNNGGYLLEDTKNPQYVVGGSYPLWLKPGFSFGDTFDEKFRVWIDFNQDGLFDETEMVLDSLLLEEDISINTNIAIPEDALEGSTRMRVSMAFSNPFFQTNQPPCGNVEFGEVEDYCILIVKNPDACPEVDTVKFDGITFTQAFMYWPEAVGAIAYTYRYREVGTIEYEEFATIDTTANLESLEKCKTYEVQVRTVCLSDTTSYDYNYLLETDCDVAVEEASPLLSSFNVFPNPFTDVLRLQLKAAIAGEYNVSIFNIHGKRMMYQAQFLDGASITALEFTDFDRYPQGMYIIVVEKDGQTTSKKVIKM